ncbi:hypothetical protein [Marinobacterium rhizophilum]|uniref:hypothetical protein n=1 Tax=Marinobacterium rhizophilum TaxID=420402 RepID=UPI00035ECA06|nr:hypothetical protein [Marinobacterium rhizophilum]
MKRIILLVLIALSVGVTLYLNRQAEPVPESVRAAVEAQLAKDARFPARPVWWQDGAILAVGMLADGAPKDAAALDVCALLLSQGITETSVEVYDLDKIRQSEDWNLIGKASCKP